MKRPHAKPSWSLESTGVFGRRSCLEGKVSLVDRDRKENLVWSQITKGLENQCADFIHSQRESNKGDFFFSFPTLDF